MSRHDLRKEIRRLEVTSCRNPRASVDLVLTGIFQRVANRERSVKRERSRESRESTETVGIESRRTRIKREPTEIIGLCGESEGS